MCDITKELKKPKTKVGYKLVIKHMDKFYSPSTLLKYSVGMKIPKMKQLGRLCYPLSNLWRNPLGKNSGWYEERMQGNTAVFSNLKQLLNGDMGLDIHPNYSILKIKLGNIKYDGRLHIGMGNYLDTHIGNEILEMKEIYVSKERMSRNSTIEKNFIKVK